MFRKISVFVKVYTDIQGVYFCMQKQTQFGWEIHQKGDEQMFKKDGQVYKKKNLLPPPRQEILVR